MKPLFCEKLTNQSVKDDQLVKRLKWISTQSVRPRKPVIILACLFSNFVPFGLFLE